MSSWNPRFVVYARAHGRTPQEQLNHDESAYQNHGWAGRMSGFVEWNNQMWTKFGDIFGRHLTANARNENPDHEGYDRWLNEQFPVQV